MKVTASKYSSIHVWLKQQYGKATLCENNECTKQSTIYHWALKKECSHDFNRENYLTLCIKCHAKYDREHGLLGMRESDSYRNIRISEIAYKALVARAKKEKRTLLAVLELLLIK